MNPLDDPIQTQYWPGICDYSVIDKEIIDRDAIQRSKIIFCATHRLREFFKILSPMDHKIVLLSSQLHGTDCSDYNTTEPYLRIAPMHNIKHWFVRNLCFNHPDVSPLPIGIQVTPQKLAIMREVSKMKVEKKYTVYANFEINTNHGEREAAYRQACLVPGAMVRPGIGGLHTCTFRDYLIEIKQSKFVLCPPGSGIDTWRLWETLYMGSIPIVKRSYMAEFYSEIFPISLVDFWEELDGYGMFGSMQEQWLSFGKWQSVINSKV